MKFSKIFALLLSLLLVFSACGNTGDTETTTTTTQEETTTLTTIQEITENAEAQENISTTEATTPTATTKKAEAVVSDSSIPEYSGKAYIALNNNQPEFTSSEITTKAFESYSSLDYSGRCGVAFACLGIETMPTEERGEIGMIKPSGWHSVKYDCVDGKYLYNRCHLIGFQLSGENANDRNLITGTRYLNIQGMLPFENMVADYIKETNNHVMYRVTPVFEGENLLCKGVKMEGYSVEDNGDGICFNVFCYNAQPSIKIDYKTGESYLIAKPTEATTKESEKNEATYILNTSSKKFHYPDCSSVGRMSEKNKKEFNGNRRELISDGYEPCKNCNP